MTNIQSKFTLTNRLFGFLNYLVIVIACSFSLSVLDIHAADEDTQRQLKKIHLKQVERFDFGKLIRNGNQASNIVISPNGQITKKNIQVLEIIRPALFHICGEPNKYFRIEPPQKVIINSSLSNYIALDAFTSTLDNWQGKLPSSGCKDIKIGVTIKWLRSGKSGEVKSKFVIYARYI